MKSMFKMFIQINKILLLLILVIMSSENFAQKQPPLNELLPAESAVILGKGTEPPFSGKYEKLFATGTYICKQCGSALFYSDSKFDAHCGWPSFDAEIPGAVTRKPDPDGRRTEITCSYCGGHLGHVFTGEGFTPRNTRHCVNSLSLDFVPTKLEPGRYGTAIFAGGCFWGVEYFLQKEPGVVSVTSGYTGGHVKNPSYREVCTGKTGHAEAVKVIYDTRKTSYEKLLRLFLEIHDPTQVNRQGPDVGEQYRSEIFWLNSEQKTLAEKYIGILKSKGLNVATRITKASEFYEAEDYHQDYYFKTGKLPYCHGYTKRF
ncbi:MAG TPA: bifunctional methionine sulfoxide reductase B/A protein [Bacteroidales bacterium]|nr:bifunctional methionine sulfoxide reductase B/A protein [Bacteroidales bacterium]HQG56088.1 bifunctional methionine sulfoxide reductase B/A protein [Bacteroidales bacterium]HQK70354.1 bifunctional methionine sulfoxide reductase B/A protein [Bacteroidales bacterium]HRR16960.1 bifunctional methionine sulfoxide reductase B/A protein [Bacteroidales bacterium]HRU56737.1 bifunctional methionine sulfoxide reductase B/A protein [Bacteroidales bacterium]